MTYEQFQEYLRANLIKPGTHLSFVNDNSNDKIGGIVITYYTSANHTEALLHITSKVSETSVMKGRGFASGVDEIHDRFSDNSMSKEQIHALMDEGAVELEHNMWTHNLENEGYDNVTMGRSNIPDWSKI